MKMYRQSSACNTNSIPGIRDLQEQRKYAATVSRVFTFSCRKVEKQPSSANMIKPNT